MQHRSRNFPSTKLRPVVEQHGRLDVNEMNRLGAFKIGRRVCFEFMGVETTRGTLAVHRPQQNLSPLKFLVNWTHCHFGGWRPWFSCLCGRRVAKLYYFGGINVGCRQCADLSHESKRKRRNARIIYQARKVRARLGDYGTPGVSKFPSRPYRMHRTTFARLAERAQNLEMKIQNPHRLTS